MAVAVAAFAVPISLVSEAGSGEPADIELGPLAQRSYVYASDGSLLASLRDEENRQPVKLEDVPGHVAEAILAVEDTGFWVHEGYDVRGMLRALRANVDAGGISQGGSTVTQQLVKLDLLSSEQTVDRKVQELVLAARLERQMSKEEILNRYLNTVYFGNHAYGVQAAAETYFGVDVGELDHGQAALLAGMIRNPVSYNPVRYPERAEQRRAAALRRMVDEGIIQENEQTWWNATPLPEELHQIVPPPDDYFVEEVKSQLLRDERLGKTYDDRYKAVFQGGLHIHTTFDPRAQVLAIAARDTNLPLTDGRFDAGVEPATGEPRYGSAAIASIEPSSGAVRAMVGGPGFDKYQYNLVTQNQRNPGSAFKTVVLATLMEQGKSPNDTVNGIGPCKFSNPAGDPDPYEPENFEGSSGSVDTIERQTLRSSNCAYVRLGIIAGNQNVIDMGHRLGIKSDLPGGLAMPLGTADLTPLELTSAYATLANDGVYNAPYYIERVEDRRGKTIFEHTPEPNRVVEPNTARLVSDILKKNIESGTGRAATIRTGHPAAGKTGTHQGSRDAWFIGYSRQLATAVWIGGLGEQFTINLGGRGITGGSYPARIWGDYMTVWHEGKQIEGFPPPGPVGEGTELKVSPDIDLTPEPPPVLPPVPVPPPESPPPPAPAPPPAAPEPAPSDSGPPPHANSDGGGDG
jgi:penicillin-binding protein 1A